MPNFSFMYKCIGLWAISVWGLPIHYEGFGKRWTPGFH